MSRIAPHDAFEILGVTPKDDFATIRRAWIRLVKENHPDLVRGDPEVLTRNLTELNEAYDALTWHSPKKVRIRQERQARQARQCRDKGSHGAEAKQQEDRTDRARTAPRDPDERTATEKKSFDFTARGAARRRKASAAKAALQGLPECLWAALQPADRFRAVQAVCAPDGFSRKALTLRCV